MTDAATILSNYGLGLTQELVEAAQAEGIELAVAATVIEMESGGRHIWGSDPGVTGGAYVKGGPVTQQNYVAYRGLVNAGRIGRQGCGVAQLTSAGYQQSGDALGGCWDVVANYRAGFRGLQALIRQYGTSGGFQHYNGSGPAAIAYANRAMSKYLVWKTRLAGATEDDLTPDQNAMLTACYQFLSGSATVVPQGTPWPGWPTWPGGTDEDLTATDLLRRANVQLNSLAAAVQALNAQLNTIALRVQGGGS